MRKFLLLLFLVPASLYAQVNITGKVVSTENKKPTPDASVFLSNSKAGNKTLKDGSFILTNIKNGRYELVVSCIGYKPYRKNIAVSDNNIHLPAIELEDRVGELDEVKIRYESKSRREYYLWIFKKAFLGNTYNASQCKILNPGVLDFDYSKKEEKLTASTSDFLIIDNKALGYRIKYLVYSFMTDSTGVTSYVGASSFKPMTGNALQERIWQNRRAKTYFGSTMHFLRSCIANAVNENSFAIRALIKPEFRPSDSIITQKIRHFKSPLYADEQDYTAKMARKDSIAYWETMLSILPFTKPLAVERILSLNEYIKLTNEKGIYAFGYPLKAVLVNYKNNRNMLDSRSSFITFLQPNVFFDSNGVIFTPGDCLFEGYWQHLRVGDQLPVDYEQPQEIEIQQAATPNTNDNSTH
jgi:hypothetical protein